MKLLNPKIFLTLLIIASCNSSYPTGNKIVSLYITVSDFHGADGYTIEYLVTKDSLKIFSDCDFEGCNNKLIYKQKSDDVKTKRFLEFVSLLRIDTLKNSYIEEGFDGLYRQVSFQKNSNKIKYVRLERSHHPTIDTLVSEIRNLIAVEKYRTMR
jgi:hypothetical protein